MLGPLAREHLPQLVLEVDGDLEDSVGRARHGQEDGQRDQGAEEDDIGRMHGAERGESRHLCGGGDWKGGAGKNLGELIALFFSSLGREAGERERQSRGRAARRMSLRARQGTAIRRLSLRASRPRKGPLLAPELPSRSILAVRRGKGGEEEDGARELEGGRALLRKQTASQAKREKRRRFVDSSKIIHLFSPLRSFLYALFPPKNLV